MCECIEFSPLLPSEHVNGITDFWIRARAAQYGKSRAKAFNVGENAKGTGVRFSDVAGIDGIKDEIKVVMDMLLGAEEYTAIGATPFRVR